MASIEELRSELLFAIAFKPDSRSDDEQAAYVARLECAIREAGPVADGTGDEEEAETYDCVIHGVGAGPDCPRC